MPSVTLSRTFRPLLCAFFACYPFLRRLSLSSPPPLPTRYLLPRISSTSDFFPPHRHFNPRPHP